MLILSILNFLKITTILFFIDILSVVFYRKNLPITLILLELILLAVNINFNLFPIYFNDALFLFAKIFSNAKPALKEVLNIKILNIKIVLTEKVLKLINQKLYERNITANHNIEKFYKNHEIFLKDLNEKKSIEIILLKLEISFINTKIEKYTDYIEILNSASLQLSEDKGPKTPRATPLEEDSIRRRKTYFYNKIVELQAEKEILESFL
jgi:NADH:ubiquinone oxidoreductase subunit K